MRAPRQPVDDGHGGVRGQLQQRIVVENPDHDGIDVTRQHPRGVGDGLAAPELHFRAGQHDRFAAELAHADVERHPGAGRGFFASKGGSKTHPAWLNNVIEHPDDIWLEVGKRKMKVHAEALTGTAREEAYGRIAAEAPNYGEYPKKTDRMIPVIRLTPASGS